jgi:hypothetical protein
LGFWHRVSLPLPRVGLDLMILLPRLLLGSWITGVCHHSQLFSFSQWYLLKHKFLIVIYTLLFLLFLFWYYS